MDATSRQPVIWLSFNKSPASGWYEAMAMQAAIRLVAGYLRSMATGASMLLPAGTAWFSLSRAGLPSTLAERDRSRLGGADG